MISAIFSTIFTAVTIMHPMSSLLTDEYDVGPILKFYNIIYLMVSEMATASMWIYYIRGEWFIPSIVLISVQIVMFAFYVLLLVRDRMVIEKETDQK